MFVVIVSYVFQGPDEMRKIAVPAHRYTPLKDNWLKIFTPIVENLQLQVRFNLKTRNVEIKVSFPGTFKQWALFTRMCCFSLVPTVVFIYYYHECIVPSFFQTCKNTQDIGSLTKAADFVKAFVLGFQVEVSTIILI